MRKEGGAKVLAKNELKKANREKNIHNFMLFVSILAFVLLLLLLLLNIFELTGFATYLESKAGYITTVSIHSTKDVDDWSGFYGLVLRVPGFTQTLDEDLDAAAIERSDIFFDCLQYDSQGGPEFYASTNPNLDLTTATVVPATTQMVDDLINCSGKEYCGSGTYTKNMTIFLGSTEISNIPSTHTYKWNGENDIFDIGILNVSGELVFVAHVNDSLHEGYNPDYLVNYQMLIPVPRNTTETYYFYRDPNDECPGGGIGNSIIANLFGYVFDSDSNIIENATVTLAGYSNYTNSSGFYNLTSEVLEGNYSVVVQADGYDPYIGSLSINFSDYVFERNYTLQTETPAVSGNSMTTNIYGYAKDVAGAGISNVSIYLGNDSITSNSTGYYNFTTEVIIGSNSFIGIRTNYNNYHDILNFTSLNTTVHYNFTMQLANLYEYPTGPYTTQREDDEAGDSYGEVRETAEELGQDYWVSTQEINKQVRENTFIQDKISIYNFKSSNMQVLFSVSSEIEDIVKLDKSSMSLVPDAFDSIILTISGVKPIGVYKGIITITGDINQEIPVRIEIVPRKFNVESLDMKLEVYDTDIPTGGNLRYKLDLQNLLTVQGYQVRLKHLILDTNNSEVLYEERDEIEIKNSLTLLKNIPLSNNISVGEYMLRIEASYFGQSGSVGSPFTIYTPIYFYTFFGIPLWLIFLIIFSISFVSFNFFMYHRHQQKKKRYHLALKLDTLPKPGERSIKIGRIAEKKVPAYYNIDDFTTHGIVAGATGGGKSISAQVFIEEMLQKNIAVIAFDPTAQWSGMLRKCDDKKMLAFYPKFGLKPNDARSFPGNVRQITNARQSIDIQKFINPGQIQIFTLNKLTPQEIDVFVAGVISNIFKSDPKEHPELKVMLVFDEVHRLLPKFGGSGKGFLQIERACREFRKWGFGVLLVSQVLSDFVGEIKANINTEVQMRVAEENDLERIRERYGLDALKSLVRAGVGTGMVQNAEYNKGLPYFVSFRPILHNTRRLTDEVLEKYNKYGEMIDNLEYQVEQLEKEKVDVFDLKMELKLVKDKLMTGNFTVVDIYLEGLNPRITKQWESLGKKPKRKEMELIDESELASSLAAAQKERKKFDEEQKKEGTSESKGEEEKKPEDKGAKIVAPLTFDNGMMVSSLNEFKDVLPNLDEAVFKAQKNDVDKWMSENIDQGLGEKVKGAKTKQEVLDVIAGKKAAKSVPPTHPKGQAKKPAAKPGEVKKLVAKEGTKVIPKKTAPKKLEETKQVKNEKPVKKK